MDSFEKERECFLKTSDNIDHRIIETHIRIGRNHKQLLDRHLNKNGLYRGQHQILMCIFRNPDASQKELARFHNVSPATIAVSLKKLEKGGYVERAADSQDNRFNKVTITEKGLNEVTNSLDFFKSVEHGMLRGFSEDEKANLYGYLQRIQENLGKMLQEKES